MSHPIISPPPLNIHNCKSYLHIYSSNDPTFDILLYYNNCIQNFRFIRFILADFKSFSRRWTLSNLGLSTIFRVRQL